MRAWVVTGRPGERDRVVQAERPVPTPVADEVLVRVRACGVCRTDLHLADLELPPRALGRIPGHEVVGTVESLGPHARRFVPGQRIGIAWLRRTCGSCRWCGSGRENLCRSSEYTGWDADGGFAEYAVVPETHAYPIPDTIGDEHAAVLLCSGIIGYRALVRSGARPGSHLGLYGYGASAHVTHQVAQAGGIHVHARTREPSGQALARRLGADSAGGLHDAVPVPLDAAILFAPAGELVPVALGALGQSGTLAVACIYLTPVPPLDYDAHLFRERTLTSVTSNTRADGDELFNLASRIDLRPQVTRYEFAHTDRALDDLAGGRVTGAAVVVVP